MISVPNGPSDWAEYSSDSRGCVDIYYDGPGDCTVRPSSGELLKRAMAMREEIARWAAWDHKPDSCDIDITLSEE
jgi:hypothetical protein